MAARRRGLGQPDPPEQPTQRSIRLAYEHFLTRTWAGRPDDGPGPGLSGLRDLVRESWQRSLVHLPQPDRVQPPLVWSEEELRRYRDRHPLAAVLPVIERLLIEPSTDSGMVVAVGDEHGRLLWVDGDRPTLARTEQMLLRPGADWSENAMGTSAPGTALVVGDSVQITGAEHFVPVVQRWNCTAVPIHGPTGRVLGVVDVTGGHHAVGPLTLAWVRAAVEVVEAELRRVRQAEGEAAAAADRRGATTIFAPGGPSDVEPRARQQATLAVLGRRSGLLRRGGCLLELSLRHSEILTVLALNPAGLTLDALAQQLDPHQSAVTLRAEMSRLRRVLDDAGLGEAGPLSRPYRLAIPVAVDAQRLYDLIARGDLDRALREYAGPPLPDSCAPGIERLRATVSLALREAVLGDGSLPAVLAYLELPEVADDAEAWTCALRLLPKASPRRAVIVAQLERIERDLG